MGPSVRSLRSFPIISSSEDWKFSISPTSFHFVTPLSFATLMMVVRSSSRRIVPAAITCTHYQSGIEGYWNTDSKVQNDFSLSEALTRATVQWTDSGRSCSTQ